MLTTSTLQRFTGAIYAFGLMLVMVGECAPCGGATSNATTAPAIPPVDYWALIDQVKLGRTKALATIGDGVLASWSTRSDEDSADLVIAVVDTIKGRDQDPTKSEAVCRMILNAIENHPKLSASQKALLVLRMPLPSELYEIPRRPGHWADDRKRIALAYIGVTESLNSAENPKWDPAKLPSSFAPLPKGVVGDSGMDPADIRDPAKRAEYIDAIKKNNELAAEYIEQTQIRRLGPRLEKSMVTFVSDLYRLPQPAGRELNDLLAGTSVPESVRSTMREKVAESPEDGK
jgi:hypothetical protein